VVYRPPAHGHCRPSSPIRPHGTGHRPGSPDRHIEADVPQPGAAGHVERGCGAIARWIVHQEDTSCDRSAPGSGIAVVNAGAAGFNYTIDETAVAKAALAREPPSPRHPHQAGAITPDDAMAQAAQSTDRPVQPLASLTDGVETAWAWSQTLRRKPDPSWRKS